MLAGNNLFFANNKLSNHISSSKMLLFALYLRCTMLCNAKHQLNAWKHKQEQNSKITFSQKHIAAASKYRRLKWLLNKPNFRLIRAMCTIDDSTCSPAV